ncbi:glycosyltransferase family 4 protein [uncultured Acetobacteroides sp.]|uniref:glycosyltransferase family 4 protein n=1 Tax=uncultured Acetobacteroides sp. TaxID=1760811 RepID=UPI0029F50BC4|nr:glycosyltransferase family 4 protein [uncultured Acetobacteroides sp.]
MRVLMFGWEYPPHISGGLGTACLGITQGLAERNVDIIFVVPKAYGDEPLSRGMLVGAEGTPHRLQQVPATLERLLNIRIPSSIHAYPQSTYQGLDKRMQSVQEVSVARASGGGFRFSGGYGPNLMAEVAHYASIGGRIARKHDFDVIHAHDWPTIPAGIVAKKATGKPLVVHFHATEYDRSGFNINRQVYDIEKMGVDEADRVICVSNLTKQTLIRRYQADERKIEVVHNGVEHFENALSGEAKARSTSEKVVSFLGRITYQKGPAFFVEAAKKVLDYLPNVRFVMAGDGDLLPAMVDRVAKLRMGDRFHFTGFLRGKEVTKLFAQTDVFVMPSVSEPFGIVPLEAMQQQVPVLISRQSGVSEVLRYALKADYWDTDSLADAIYGLVTYPALHSFLSANGHAESMSLSWADAAKKIERCYQKVVGEVA